MEGKHALKVLCLSDVCTVQQGSLKVEKRLCKGSVKVYKSSVKSKPSLLEKHFCYSEVYPLDMTQVNFRLFITINEIEVFFSLWSLGLPGSNRTRFVV